MNNNYKWKDNWGCLWYILAFISIYTIIAFINVYDKVGEGINSGNYLTFVIGIVIVSVSLIIYFNYKITDIKYECNNRIDASQRFFDSQKKEIEDRFAKEKNIIEKEKSSIEEKMRKQKQLLDSKTPFCEVAQMRADYETCIYEKEEYYLRYKPHPAESSADKVKLIRGKLNEAIIELRTQSYQMLFLQDLFPELKQYMEDEGSLLFLNQYKNFDVFNERRDRTHDWMTEEEYRRMGVDERNQLALDRYANRKLTNSEAGLEYERYVGYLLRTKGYNVEQNGIVSGVHDLGRDIIATRWTANGSVTYVIQCKRYSVNSDIWIVRENTVCQTYGTSIEYELSHPYLSNKIIPVIVTTKELTETAKRFADRLGVEVWIVPMGKYPMIKCNINQRTGEKIYHLPFDQQYETTQINQNGECYAFTVKEAVDKGFRRAMKHFVVNS